MELFQDAFVFSPIPQGSPNGNFVSGHLQYGVDGAYENGALLAAACLVAYLAASELVGTARVPEGVREILATLSVTYRRTAKPEDRAVNCWKDTILKHAVNRPMDPFMRYRVLESFGLLQQDAAINAAIKKVNQFFFAQPKVSN